LPSSGSKLDSKGTTHVVVDPREFLKVIRSGGSFPSGSVEALWVSKKWNELRDMKSRGLFGSGEEWKRIRTFMQTDLLHPEAARGYAPALIQAAKLASKGAPAHKDDLKNYLNYCSFDLFSSVMFGEMTEAANSGKDSDSKNVAFAKHATDGIAESIELLLDPFENMVGNGLGITTKRQQFVFDNFDRAWEIGFEKIEDFMKSMDDGKITESQKNSYLYRAVHRQKEEGSNVTIREAQELAWTGLFAAVDTTSSVLAWNLFHIARSADIQKTLFEELSRSVHNIGKGELTGDVLSRENAPYLHAVIRESHRLTPSVVGIMKRVDKEIEVNGVALKEGEVVMFQSYTIGMDPDLVDNPDEFLPERWLPNAVAERKGTKKEVIDHSFLKEPFSQGARRCPGSRVAATEVQIMLAQLVLDWKMESSVKSMKDIDYRQKTTVELIMPKIDFKARMEA